jgi:hypothetical protein
MGEVEKLEGVPYELWSRQDDLPTQCSEVVVTSFTNECTALSLAFRFSRGCSSRPGRRACSPVQRGPVW